MNNVCTRRGAATFELAIGLPLLMLFLAGILSVGAAGIAKTKASVRARHAAWARRAEAEVAAASPFSPAAGTSLAESHRTAAPGVDRASARYVVPSAAPAHPLLLTLASAGGGSSDPLKISDAEGNPLTGLRGGDASETAFILPALGWGRMEATSSVDIVGGVWDSRAILAVEFDVEAGDMLETLIQQILRESGLDFESCRIPYPNDILREAKFRMESDVAELGMDVLTAEDGFLAQRLAAELDRLLCDWLGEIADKFEQIVDAAEAIVSNPLRGVGELVNRLEEFADLLTSLQRLDELLSNLQPLSTKLRIDFQWPAPELDIAEMFKDLFGLADPSSLLSFLTDGPFSSLDKLLERLFGNESLSSILNSLSCGGHLAQIRDTAGRIGPQSIGDALASELESVTSALEGVQESIK